MMQTPDFSVFFLLFNRLITYDLPESRRADLASDMPRGERGGRVKPGATWCDGRGPAWLGSPANQPRGPRQRPPWPVSSSGKQVLVPFEGDGR